MQLRPQVATTTVRSRKGLVSSLGPRNGRVEVFLVSSFDGFVGSFVVELRLEAGLLPEDLRFASLVACYLKVSCILSWRSFC